eukprot:TRINITY_DN12692_c0_g2_i1.p1 TRINITY_DN12692_c0_g2~~TRINITY_DN12692_c0_g2_i1.p1  ORF type:complete len:383 (-),score=53.31 TRINITY_DN12692_c0_g2_i1:69-1217(-)
MNKTAALALLSSPAVLFAILGGLVWGIGPLGRKSGVSDVRGSLITYSAVTATVYNVGNILMPAIFFFMVDAEQRQRVVADAKYRSSLPWLMLSATLAASGSCLAAYALGISTRNESCLVNMVECAVYSVLSSILIIWLFGERPSPTDYVAGVLLILGTLAVSAAHIDDDDGEQKRAITEASDDKDGAAPRYGAAEPSQSRPSTSSVHSTMSTTTASRKQSMSAFAVAVASGTLWACGILGKRYSAKMVPKGLEKQGSAITYVIYQTVALPVPALFLCLLSAFGTLSFEGIRTWFQMKAPKVYLCGLISGVGGALVIYALTLTAESAALISLVADSLYTVSSALIIAVLYGERPNAYQLAGVCIILAAIISVELKNIEGGAGS